VSKNNTGSLPLRGILPVMIYILEYIMSLAIFVTQMRARY